MNLRALVPVAVAAYVAFPATATGLYGDDASDANLNGFLAERGESLLSAAWATSALWVRANGRLFPVYVLEKYAVFHWLADVTAYKWFLFALTVATVAAFVWFTGVLAGGAFAAVAGTIAAVSLQMRGYHDALYSYNGMVQIMLLVLIASLWCWRSYLLSGSRALGALALALYALNGLTYEFSYLFFPLYACVAPARGARGVFAALWPPAAVGTCLIAVALGLRAHATIAPGTAYAVGREPAGYALAFARQATAALPLSYFAWNPSRIFPPLGNAFARTASYALNPVGLVLLAAAAVAVLLPYVRRGPVPAGRDALRLAGLGAGLWLLPGALVAASAKYQRELEWGIGYLPVLISVFGVAILGALLLGAAAGAARRGGAGVWLVVLAGAAIGLAGALTRADNERVALELRPWLIGRAAVAAALNRGAFGAVPDGAAVTVSGPLPWLCLGQDGCPDDLDGRYFVFAHAGKRVELGPAPGRPGAVRLRYGAAKTVLAVVVADGPDGASRVYLAAAGPGCTAPALAGSRRLAAGPGWTLSSVGPAVAGAASLETSCGTVELPG